MAYDIDRQTTETTFADGRTVTVGYDDAGRRQTIELSRGALGVTYDAAGRVEQIAAPGGIADTFSYDGNLLVGDARSGPVAGTVSWGYDADFRIAAQGVEGGQAVSYEYDADNRLTRVGDLTFVYSADNALMTGAQIGQIEETWAYNQFGEATQYDVRFDDLPIYSLALSYDALGRVTRKVENIEGATTTYDYSYDLAGRLSTVATNGTTSATYTYDTNGNRLTRSAGATVETSTYDAQDRLVSTQQSGPAGQRTYSYNAHGQLQSATVDGQVTAYVYDEMDNLVAAERPDGSELAYLVDGLNRRIARRVDGALDFGLLYQSQWKLAAETDGAGQVAARFVYGDRARPEYLLPRRAHLPHRR